MTPEQVELVKESFKQVPADKAAALFYERLFEIAPNVRPMFKTDITTQGKKVMATLAVVIKGLDDIESLLPAVRQLGRRHADLGVTSGHYWVVGRALVWTLQECLGEAFTDEVEEAWVEAYGVLAAEMIGAASKQAA